jgi:diguanylate cyclase (GGDEF)-like protein/PAS domain S-box-containing protein
VTRAARVGVADSAESPQRLRAAGAARPAVSDAALGRARGTAHAPRDPSRGVAQVNEPSQAGLDPRLSEVLGEARFGDYFAKNASVMLLVDPGSGTIVAANPTAVAFYGYPLARLAGMPITELNTLPSAQVRTNWREANAEERNHFFFRHRLASGELRDVEVFSTPIACGDRRLLLSIVHDVTDRRRAEERLQLAANVVTHAREGIAIVDARGLIVEVNDAFTRITGWTREEVVGTSAREGAASPSPLDAQAWREVEAHGHWSGEAPSQRRDGTRYLQSLTLDKVRDPDGAVRSYIALVSDVTDTHDHQRRLEYVAHHDALTGLPNRLLLVDRLHQATSIARRRGQFAAVFCLDLDDFRTINDALGHELGDRLLGAVAMRLRGALREGDTLARLGGDEFAGVLVDLPDAGSGATRLLRLLSVVAEPIEVGTYQLTASASIGVTFYPQEGEEADAEQLLRQADQAMYQAKLTGKNRLHVFDAAGDRTVRGAHETIERVQRALEERELVLHYQPKVDMRSGEMHGVEALLRWQHPERGLLPPATFLPVIEEHPLSVQVGEWVIDAALAQIEAWHDEGLDLGVSVNVGARQLQDRAFVETLVAALAAHPRAARGRLSLEVLESSALEDVEQVTRVMRQCREIGVSFALDDFGTGYSSLAYLKRLPADELKIDQSFVRDMLNDTDDLAILEGILGLASAFRRRVVAEGVETPEHGEMLIQLGCELGQGYGIARPMPADRLPSWCRSWRPPASWTRARPAAREDLALVAAAVEHRAWVDALERHLRGQGESPVLDPDACRFGRWLRAEGARYLLAEHYIALEGAHRTAHAAAVDLLRGRAQGEHRAGLERLDALYVARDALLSALRGPLRDRYG